MLLRSGGCAERCPPVVQLVRRLCSFGHDGRPGCTRSSPTPGPLGRRRRLCSKKLLTVAVQLLFVHFSLSVTGADNRGFRRLCRFVAQKELSAGCAVDPFRSAADTHGQPST